MKTTTVAPMNSKAAIVYNNAVKRAGINNQYELIGDGDKASRPNLLGLPDLVKPVDWEALSHDGNHGLLTK